MKLAFCFPGQGSLEPGMGKDVVESVPEARDVFRRAAVAGSTCRCPGAARARFRMRTASCT